MQLNQAAHSQPAVRRVDLFWVVLSGPFTKPLAGIHLFCLCYLLEPERLMSGVSPVCLMEHGLSCVEFLGIAGGSREIQGANSRCQEASGRAVALSDGTAEVASG